MSSESEQRQQPSRRGILRTGAGIAAVAATGSAFSLGAAGSAAASVPSSKHFLLSGAGGNPVWRAPLHQPTWAMQSFAFDSVNSHIYFAQHRIGDSTGHNGDLWISKTDLSGNVLDIMALHGFGHGSSMGVESTGSGSEPYLWIEGSDSDDNGAGEKLSRFRFVAGLTLDYSDHPAVTIYDRTPTISSFVKLPRPAIDTYSNRLLIRYATDATAKRLWRLAVFDMDDAVAGRLSDGYRLVERAIPNNGEIPGLEDTDYFQGIVSCGEYAYLTYGRANNTSYLVTLDLNDSGASVYDVFETSAGASLPGREPQGIATWMVSGQPRLAFGFSSKTAASPDDLLDASVFYKSDFIS